MKKWNILFALVALTGFVAWGCGGAQPTGQYDEDYDAQAAAEFGQEGNDDDSGAVTPASATAGLKYCGACGHAFPKDSEHKCDSDHAVCEKCGLHEGSELCCVKLEGDFAGKTLCGSCGQVAGSDACCAEGAEVCADCGLHKGSVLCCKLGAKVTDEGTETPTDEGDKPADESSEEATAPAKEGDKPAEESTDAPAEEGDKPAEETSDAPEKSSEEGDAPVEESTEKPEAAAEEGDKSATEEGAAAEAASEESSKEG